MINNLEELDHSHPDDVNAEVAQQVIDKIFYGYNSFQLDEQVILQDFLLQMFLANPDWNVNVLQRILENAAKTFDEREWIGRLETKGILGGGVYHKGKPPDSIRLHGERPSRPESESDRPRKSRDDGSCGTD